MKSYIFAIVLGVGGGTMLRGLYAVLRLRRDSLKSPLGYIELSDPLGYVSINEFLGQKRKLWLQYILFRTLPPSIVFILVIGIFQKLEFEDIAMRFVVGFIVLVTYCLFDIRLFNSKNTYTTTKLLYILTVLLMILIGLIVIGLSLLFNLSVIIPTFTSLRDNIWSAVFAAIIVAIFVEITDMNRDASKNESQEQEWAYFIDQQKLLILEKFKPVIYKTASRFGLDEDLMVAILIYENLNRPKFIRCIENILVTVLPITMTVGVAQVSSNIKLTDEESIIKMGEVLSNAYKAHEGLVDYEIIRRVIFSYNCSEKYVENVMRILFHLR